MIERRLRGGFNDDDELDSGPLAPLSARYGEPRYAESDGEAVEYEPGVSTRPVRDYDSPESIRSTT